MDTCDDCKKKDTASNLQFHLHTNKATGVLETFQHVTQKHKGFST